MGPKRILLLLLFGFFSLSLLYSMGDQEDPIQQARNLVEEKQYNEAILILSEVIATDPERLDEAESLLSNIRQIRSDYNNVYEELIKVLYEDKDVETALQLIEELESLDENPNAATLSAVAKAKESALFVYNQNQFNDIMTRGLALIQDEKYWEAVTLYESGFSLYREEFFESGFGNIIESLVTKGLNNLEGATVAFKELQAEYQNQIEAMNNALAGEDSDEIVIAFRTYSEFMFNVVEQARLVTAAAHNFEEQNRRIMLVKETDKEEFFLGFIQRFAIGRNSIDEFEGIAGAIQKLTSIDHEAIDYALTELNQKLYLQAIEALEEKSFDEARALLNRNAVLSGVALDSAAIWQAKVFVDKNSALTDDAKDFVENTLTRYLDNVSIALASEKLEALAGISTALNVFNIQQASVNGETTRQTLVEQRRVVNSNLLQIEDIASSWSTVKTEAENRVGERFSTEAVNRFSQLEAIISESTDFAQEVEILYADRIAALDYGPIKTAYDIEAERIATIGSFLEGVEQTVLIGEEENIFLAKYPSQALDSIEIFNAQVTPLEEQLNNFITTYSNEINFVRTSQQNQTHLNNARSLLRSLGSLRVSASRLASNAEDQLLLAERYKNEGTLKIGEARAAVNRNEFDFARESLGDARELFTISLSYQEDQNLRGDTDAQILALADAITEAENQLVIREVRELITQGRTFYRQNEFEKAEDTLLRAQTRWMTTQTEENTEVIYWLNFVRAALFVESARQIQETDPLYTEITQLLNLAKEDYYEGRKLYEKGQNREGERVLGKAEEKLLKVTLPFPQNQEASLLSLRIEQLKDRENFLDLFGNKFREARDKIDTAPEEAYIELTDLQVINSGYPGMTNAIYRAEIAIGIRVPPPDPAALNESNALYSQAAAIFNRNDRANFTIALEQLNRAIELNPENDTAISLKDRIQLAYGGQTSVVLPSYAQARYKEAEEKYIAGELLLALQIVQQLLQDEASKNYPPLLELKKRIESRI